MEKTWKDRSIRVGEAPLAYLEVRNHPDAPEFSILIETGPNQSSQTYFGEVSLTLSGELARVLGEALIEMADKQEAERE